MIIKRVYEEYGFNIENLLIKESKRLKLSTKELTVLLTLFNVSPKRRTFSISAIEKKLDYTIDELGEIIESLMNKDFLRITMETNNKKEREVYDLDGVFDKIEKLYLDDELEKKKSLTVNNVSDTITIIEDKLGRMLRSNELDRIRTWYEEFNYEHSHIINIINSVDKISSIIYLEKLLTLNIDSNIKHSEDTDKLLDDIFKKL